MEMRKKVNHGYRVFNVVSTILIGLFALVCLLPFLLLLIGSFMDNNLLILEGYSFFPKKWSLDGYRFIFQYPFY